MFLSRLGVEIGNEGLDLRVHHGAPAAAAEDAVMARTLDFKVVAFAPLDLLAQGVCGPRLASAGDVVTVKGVVRTDRDFGSGYAYKVLIEEATLQQ